MPLFVGFYINQYFGIPLSVTYVCYQLESFLNRSFDTLYDFSGSVCFGFFRMQLGSFLRPQKPWHLQKTKFTPEWFFEHFRQNFFPLFVTLRGFWKLLLILLSKKYLPKAKIFLFWVESVLMRLYLNSFENCEFSVNKLVDCLRVQTWTKCTVEVFHLCLWVYMTSFSNLFSYFC